MIHLDGQYDDRTPQEIESLVNFFIGGSILPPPPDNPIVNKSTAIVHNQVERMRSPRQPIFFCIVRIDSRRQNLKLKTNCILSKQNASKINLSYSRPADSIISDSNVSDFRKML